MAATASTIEFIDLLIITLNPLSLPGKILQGKLPQFVCSLIKARTIRNKPLIIQDFVVDNLVDILAITETYFSRCGDEMRFAPLAIIFQSIKVA